MLIVIQAFYFVLPAYLANMMPVFFAKLGWLSWLNKPIDFGAKLGNQPLFGQNKTWRGLVVAVLGGIIIAGGQHWLYSAGIWQSIAVYDYQSWLLFGFLAGLGAIVGDFAKSFFKRRVGIKPGGVWPVFDQLDFIAGFFLFTAWVYWPGLAICLIVFGITLLLHPLTNIVGYALGVKKVWW